MITANQAARFRAAAALYEARDKLLPLGCSGVFTREDSDALERVLAEIEALFSRVIPK